MVTINDIAKHTGLSRSTVSAVLSGRAGELRIRGATCEAVREAAGRLGYRRNELAATMRTGDNRAVALICRYDEAGLASDTNIIISGILGEATRLNHELKIYSDEDLPACFDKILGGQIQKMISLSVDHRKREDTAAFCRSRGIKLVYVYEAPHGEFPAVVTDNERSARDSVMYLAGKGHRRIAMICGPHRFSYVNEHHDGYLRGLRDAGLEPRRELMTCGEDVDARERAAGEILRMPAETRPTAFYCIGDSLAMMLQRVAIKNGLAVPEDVSMVGYGNADLAKSAFCPLTSVEQPFGKMGEVALRLLLGAAESLTPTAEGRYLLPARLVERESVMELTVESPARRRGCVKGRAPVLAD